MEDPQIVSTGRTVLQAVAKLVLVSAECVAAGWAVGTAAHYVGGSFGFGLDLGAFELAAFEGGIQGALIGLPVGLLIYYVILRSRATWKDWAILVGVAFITAATTFLPLGIITFLVTPLVTLIVASVLGFRR